MHSAWLLLLTAGFFEICLAMGLKVSEGFSKLAPSVLTIVATILSFYFLSKSLKSLPIGTAYAIWTSIGASGTVICGYLFLGESLSLMKIGFILLIVLGVLGLKLTS